MLMQGLGLRKVLLENTPHWLRSRLPLPIPLQRKDPKRQALKRSSDPNTPNEIRLTDPAKWTVPVHNPLAWHPGIVRCGALAIKSGMLTHYDSWGKPHPVTVLNLADCIALDHYPAGRVTTYQPDHFLDANGQNPRSKLFGKYVQEVGIDSKVHLRAGLERTPAVQLSYFARIKCPVMRRVRGFVVSEDARMPPGTPLRAAHFVPGQLVSVQARSIGKGFQGVMKRHGFAGMPASHGVSLSHRHGGCLGSREDPAKVFKGKKMPGRMGNTVITTHCLKVHDLYMWCEGPQSRFRGQLYHGQGSRSGTKVWDCPHP